MATVGSIYQTMTIRLVVQEVETELLVTRKRFIAQYMRPSTLVAEPAALLTCRVKLSSRIQHSSRTVGASACETDTSSHRRPVCIHASGPSARLSRAHNLPRA